MNVDCCLGLKKGINRKKNINNTRQSHLGLPKHHTWGSLASHLGEVCITQTKLKISC